MAIPMRLRGPKGISTINVDLQSTVADLQQIIFGATEIPPSLQILKKGYPPSPLTLIPSLPISSLGLVGGEQLIVSAASGDMGPARLAQSHHSKAPIPSLRARPTNTISASELDSTPPLIPPSASGIPPERPAEAEDHVDVDGSVLILRVVPDDNSCLFSSIALIFLQDIAAAPKLRSVVADTIRNDSVQYDEAFLGQPREQYMSTIVKPTAWGGAIELSIFADYFQTEISSFDVETGRCDRFGEDRYDNRCIIMYSGIHYDAVSLAPTHTAPLDFHQTVFPINLRGIFDAAGQLAEKRRSKKAYTNTATFDLRCQVCGKGLKGENEAREHAKQTSHAEFGEY